MFEEGRRDFDVRTRDKRLCAGVQECSRQQRIFVTPIRLMRTSPSRVEAQSIRALGWRRVLVVVAHSSSPQRETGAEKDEADLADSFPKRIA